MGSHTENPYTLITDRAELETALQSTDHCSAHVNMFFRDRTLLGHNEIFFWLGKFDGRICGSFGGWSAQYEDPEAKPETVLETVLRDGMEEEALHSLVSDQELKHVLRERGFAIKRYNPKFKAWHYTVYIGINRPFPMSIQAHRTVYKFKRAGPGLNKGSLENTDLHAVSWNRLHEEDHGEMKPLVVEDSEGEIVTIREHVLPGYRFLRTQPGLVEGLFRDPPQ